MLALGMEQGPRRCRKGLAGGGEGKGGIMASPGVATTRTHRHTHSSGQPLPRAVTTKSSPLDIRQKISQWEGLSQVVECHMIGGHGHGRGRGVVLRRGLSGEALEFQPREQSQQAGGHTGGKPSLTKAKSLGLDFREEGLPPGSAAFGHKVHPQNNHNHSQKHNHGHSHNLKSSHNSHALTTQAPTHAFRVTTAKFTTATDVPGMNVEQRNKAVQVSGPLPLPPLAHHPEDRLPPGNFYTSRGFWKQLEATDLPWDKSTGLPVGRTLGNFRFTDACPGPPKPQRTFQYRGAENPLGNWVQMNHHQSGSSSRSKFSPPSCALPPCPVGHGLSRHKKNRRSFEFEDVARLPGQQRHRSSAGRRSGLYHARSQDSIYEDVIANTSRENHPYEDVKLSPMCLPIGRTRPWTLAQKPQKLPQTPKLPPKPVTLRTLAERTDRGLSKGPTSTATSRPSGTKHCTGSHIYRLPQYVVKIQEVFQTKRGWKRVKTQIGTSKDEASGTESDPEEGSKDDVHKLVYVQSTLRRRPGYRTLEKDLIQLQQQQLFQLFVVVSLRKSTHGNTYNPEITQQFPTKFEKSSRLSREAEDRLKVIPLFCFPDSQDWKPSNDMSSETFSFVLTGEDGSRWFGYCRKILPVGKGKRLPEVHCIVSRLGCFNLFAKILEEVERRREISPALVYPFMRSVMEAPFPGPGRTISVKSFLPGSGNEVLTLCRPVDSRLEHVDFDSLLHCLSIGNLLQVFASLLLERRVIFIADKLSTLSRCAHSALALLYPFTWQHTFVPVLPASMLDICCSPTPFLMGAVSPSLPMLLQLPIEEVLIVDLCADKLVVQLGDEDCILPSKLQAALHDILENREQILSQDDIDRHHEDECDLTSLISEAFVRFFVELVGHYPLHMGEGETGGTRELQREAFRKSHPSRGVRQFLQLFMDTQMFAGFIQDRELRKGGVKGLFDVRATEYLDSQPEPEPSGVNRFLKGLGSKMKFLQKK